MMRRITWFPMAAFVAAATVVLVLLQSGYSQERGSLLGLLERRIETTPLMKDHPKLSEVLNYTSTKAKSTTGKELPIYVDFQAFKAETPDAPDIMETVVGFRPALNEMKVGDLLRAALDCVESKNATFVVMPDHILITTYFRASAGGRLHQRVRGDFKGQLGAVLREVAESVGASIIIDHRVGDNAKTAVAVTFLNDTPLAGVLRTVTEMSDLKVVVLDGVIFVTTPAHADVLRKEQQAKTPAATLTPAGFPSGLSGGSAGFAGFPPGTGFGGGVGALGGGFSAFGGGVGFAGVPGVGSVPGWPGFPGAASHDPLWPYVYTPTGPWVFPGK